MQHRIVLIDRIHSRAICTEIAERLRIVLAKEPSEVPSSLKNLIDRPNWMKPRPRLLRHSADKVSRDARMAGFESPLYSPVRAQTGTFGNSPSWFASDTKELRHEEYSHLSCSWCRCDLWIHWCGCRTANKGPRDAAR